MGLCRLMLLLSSVVRSPASSKTSSRRMAWNKRFSLISTSLPGNAVLGYRATGGGVVLACIKPYIGRRSLPSPNGPLTASSTSQSAFMQCFELCLAHRPWSLLPRKLEQVKSS